MTTRTPIPMPPALADLAHLAPPRVDLPRPPEPAPPEPDPRAARIAAVAKAVDRALLVVRRRRRVEVVERAISPVLRALAGRHP